jgi:predicted NUDIX family NTP pyrophosphohydrolase
MASFRALTPRRLKSGKLLHIFAIEGDVDADAIRSNLFSMEWPPRSGKQQAFPEVDRGAWFALDEARLRIHESQRPMLSDLEALLNP